MSQHCVLPLSSRLSSRREGESEADRNRHASVKAVSAIRCCLLVRGIDSFYFRVLWILSTGRFGERISMFLMFDVQIVMVDLWRAVASSNMFSVLVCRERKFFLGF